MRSGMSPEYLAWEDEQFRKQMEELLEFLYRVKDDPNYKRRIACKGVGLIGSNRNRDGRTQRKYGSRKSMRVGKNDHIVINLGKVYDEWRSSQNPRFSLNNRCYVRYDEAQPEMSAFLDFIAGIDIPQSPPIEHPEGE